MGLSTRNYELRFACLFVLQDPRKRASGERERPGIAG